MFALIVFLLIVFLLIALAMTSVSGELVWVAWSRGFGDAGVYVLLAHMCGAVVILIAAGRTVGQRSCSSPRG